MSDNAHHNPQILTALIQLPLNTFHDKHCSIWAPHEHWSVPSCAVLLILTDLSVIALIKEGCDSDPFANTLWDWCTRSTTYQWSLVHWGPAHYSSNRREPFHLAHEPLDILEGINLMWHSGMHTIGHKSAQTLHPLPVLDQWGDSGTGFHWSPTYC